MSTKYTYDNYIFTLDFKNEFEMAITASDLLNGDIFINQNAVLEKIKKDTVIAVLSRKNEKCLSCKFNLVDVEPRKLIITFEVSFDFLPTFTEYVSLDQIEKKGSGLNKVESAELRSDIEELEKMLTNMSCKESNYFLETTHSFNQKGQMLSKTLERGSYLLEVTGTFLCAVAKKHSLLFQIEVDGQKFELLTCLHTNGGYGYPYAVRKEFIISNKSQMKLSVTHSENQSFQMYQNIISIFPMLKVN